MAEPATKGDFGPTTPGPAGIGERLRLARRARGISQRSLQSAGVSFAYISRIERGRRIPSLEVLRRLSAALDVSPHWLETGSEGRWHGLADAELAAIHVALSKSRESASLRLAAELSAVLELRAGAELAPQHPDANRVD